MLNALYVNGYIGESFLLETRKLGDEKANNSAWTIGKGPEYGQFVCPRKRQNGPLDNIP